MGFRDCQHVLEKRQIYLFAGNRILILVMQVKFPLTTHLPDTRNFYITHCRVDDLKTTSIRVKIISVIIDRFQIICNFKLRMFQQM